MRSGVLEQMNIHEYIFIYIWEAMTTANIGTQAVLLLSA